MSSGMPLKNLHLVDRAVGPAFAAGSVVRDHDDEGVLALAGLLQIVEEPTDLVVGVGQEPGVDLGHPTKQALLVL